MVQLVMFADRNALRRTEKFHFFLIYEVETLAVTVALGVRHPCMSKTPGMEFRCDSSGASSAKGAHTAIRNQCIAAQQNRALKKSGAPPDVSDCFSRARFPNPRQAVGLSGIPSACLGTPAIRPGLPVLQGSAGEPASL